MITATQIKETFEKYDFCKHTMFRTVDWKYATSIDAIDKCCILGAEKLTILNRNPEYYVEGTNVAKTVLPDRFIADVWNHCALSHYFLGCDDYEVRIFEYNDRVFVDKQDMIEVLDMIIFLEKEAGVYNEV